MVLCAFETSRGGPAVGEIIGERFPAVNQNAAPLSNTLSTGRSCASRYNSDNPDTPADTQPAHTRSLHMPAPTSSVKTRHTKTNVLVKRLERQRQALDDQAELLVRAVAAHLLRHHLAQHGDHREAAVLQLLELLLGEDLQRDRVGVRG